MMMMMMAIKRRSIEIYQILYKNLPRIFMTIESKKMQLQSKFSIDLFYHQLSNNDQKRTGYCIKLANRNCAKAKLYLNSL